MMWMFLYLPPYNSPSRNRLESHPDLILIRLRFEPSKLRIHVAAGEAEISDWSATDFLFS